MPTTPRVRCPKCRGDQISMVEVTEVIGTTDYGVIVIEDGGMVPPSDFWFEPGNILRLELQCGSCKHSWRPRKHAHVTPQTRTPDA